MNDIKYMRAALILAANGEGFVEPNPMVGCVIVKKNRIIGSGYHENFGGPHAEINALADCTASGSDPAGATMYVTLEPCSHHGKTPPCADAVIESKIAEVVIAALDPTDKVAGKGIEKLRNAGIKVRSGICEKQAISLNPGFYKLAQTATPWVILKWAQSEDGFMAYKNTAKYGQWVSNRSSRNDANFLRRSIQAILVGVNTVIEDDPLLTIRPESDRQPLRVVLDSRFSIPMNSQILDTSVANTLIVTTENADPEKIKQVTSKGPEVLIVKETFGRCDLKELLIELGKRNVQQLLVEGGPKVIDAFLTENLADVVRVYKSTKKLAKLGAIPITDAMAEVVRKMSTDVQTKDFDRNTRMIRLLNNNL